MQLPVEEAEKELEDLKLLVVAAEKELVDLQGAEEEHVDFQLLEEGVHEEHEMMNRDSDEVEDGEPMSSLQTLQLAYDKEVEMEVEVEEICPSKLNLLLMEE